MGQRIDIDESELVALLADKNIRGLEILYDNYSEVLYFIIFSIVMDHHVTEDLLQEAFLRIWQTFSMYDKRKGRLATWLITIVRNLAMDKFRSKEFKNHAKKNKVELDFLDGLMYAQVYNTDRIGLKEMVNKLKPEQKMLIDILYFQGYTHMEASAALNIPLGTIKTRIRTAILNLREQFNAKRQNTG